MKVNTDRQLVAFKITPDLTKVKIKFNEVLTIPGDEEDEESESEETRVPYSVVGPFRPHKDLINALKKLRKHALSILDLKLEDEAKQLSEFNVLEFKIQGDMLTKQSRIKMKLFKSVQNTGAVVAIGPLPHVTMYPAQDDSSKYHDVAKLTPIIEEVTNEIWEYLWGKYDESIPANAQLVLFPRETPKMKKVA